MSKTNVKTQNIKNKVRSAAPARTGAHRRNLGPAAAIGLSVFAGAVMLLISSAIFSFILEKSSNPDSLIPVCSVAATLIAGAVCGAVSAKITERPLPWSIVSGIAMVLVYLIISLFFDPADTDSDMIFKTVILACVLLSSLVFGIITGKKSVKAKRRH